MQWLSLRENPVTTKMRPSPPFPKVIGLIGLSETADTFAGRNRVEASTATGNVVAEGIGVITGKLVAPEALQ